MHRRNILLLFTFIFCLAAIAQEEEYIITNDNDTIFGKIVRGTDFWNTSKIVFKIKNKEGKKTRIDPSQVKIIKSLKGVDGDCIIYTVYDRWFAKKIIEGRINVYKDVDGGALTYVSKDDSAITYTEIGLFSRKKAHTQIRLLIEDNSKILKEFDSLNGSAKNVFYIIEKYNIAEE